MGIIQVCKTIKKLGFQGQESGSQENKKKEKELGFQGPGIRFSKSSDSLNLQ